METNIRCVIEYTYHVQVSYKSGRTVKQYKSNISKTVRTFMETAGKVSRYGEHYAIYTNSKY